jgi:signal peptidase II
MFHSGHIHGMKLPKLPSRAQYLMGATICGIAAAAWGIDALTKMWARTTLGSLPPPHGIVAIPNFMYFVLGTNYGGSNGVPPAMMEFCLAVPAAIMFIAANWIGRRLKKGRSLTALQQLGFGLFLGGALANWSERVLHNGVTDFIFLQPFGFCIFNLADIFIDLGYTTLIFEFGRIAWVERKRRRQAGVVQVAE